MTDKQDSEQSDVDVEQLQERIDHLEATVQKMLPDRRQALKALAVGGSGAGLGAALSGSAAGQQFGSSTGQVGTDSEPLNEVTASTGTFQSLSTDSQTINNSLDATALNQGTPSSPVTFVSHGSGVELAGIAVATTDVAGDNANDIIFALDDPPAGGVFYVMGENSDLTKTFLDIVSVSRLDSVSVVDSNTESTAGARAYASSASNGLELAIDDSGETYSVTVHAFVGQT